LAGTYVMTYTTQQERVRQATSIPLTYW